MKFFIQPCFQGVPNSEQSNCTQQFHSSLECYAIEVIWLDLIFSLFFEACSKRKKWEKLTSKAGNFFVRSPSLLSNFKSAMRPLNLKNDNLVECITMIELSESYNSYLHAVNAVKLSEKSMATNEN